MIAREIEKLGRTEWAANYLASAKRPFEIRIAPGEHYPSPIHKLAASEEVVSLISIPLIYGDKLVGLIMLYHKTELHAHFRGLDVR